MSIVYKNRLLIENLDDFPMALAFLYAFYFIFDVSYPKVFMQVLGFFYELCFQFEEISFKKSENFNLLADVLKARSH